MAADDRLEGGRSQSLFVAIEEFRAQVDADSVNMHVVNPTTAAQYFHALRRQFASE